MTHEIVKPEVIAQLGAVALEAALTIPATFVQEGIDQYKGAKDDTINVKIDGILPFRTYGWRNDRSTAIQFDEYKERTVPVQFGGDVYNAIHLTDEQADFDLGDWTKLATKQAEGVARGLNYEAAETVIDAPYEYTVGVHESKVRKGLIEARRVLNRLNAPLTGRVLLVGSGWEAAILNSDNLTLALNVGDSNADSALREATIGRLFGFDIVVANELPEDEAIALSEGAFVSALGAPSVPQSVPFGATASHEGVAIRWLRDYDLGYKRDRSLFDVYKGFRHVVDPLVGVDEATKQGFVSEYEHFVRAIKLELNGEANYPAVTAGTGDEAKRKTEIAKITKLAPVADLEEAPASGSGGGTED